MGLGETGVTWVCPACSRRVPMRVENCRCGGLRPERPSASPAARRVPEDAPREASQSAFDPAPGEPVEAPPPSPRFASPDGGIPRSGFDESLRHPGETARFWCSAVFAAAFWLFILITIIGVAYAAAILIFSLIARALFLGSVRGNGIEVSEHQLPHIHAAVVRASRRLGLKEPPHTYVMQSGGALNAFATHLLSRNYVIVFSSLIDACADRRQLDFVVAHEVGHLAAGHLKWMGFLAPAHFVPWLGTAYSRACEYTCDRCGLAVVEDIEAADRGLLVLAAGGKAAGEANVEAFMNQRLDTGSFWSAAVELGSTHPFLCKRVAALREFRQPGSMSPVSRNPLAYLIAPFTSVGGAAGAGGGFLVMVFVIGLVAAIAIPSLLRARVAANEAAMIGNARTVISAQQAFHSVAGKYGAIQCLKAPASCIPNYPPGGPVFLSDDFARPGASGYEQEIVHDSEEGFVYLATPLTPGTTGIRTFCADARGMVCSAASPLEASAGTSCSPICQPIR